MPYRRSTVPRCERDNRRIERAIDVKATLRRACEEERCWRCVGGEEVGDGGDSRTTGRSHGIG